MRQLVRRPAAGDPPVGKSHGCPHSAVRWVTHIDYLGRAWRNRTVPVAYNCTHRDGSGHLGPHVDRDGHQW